MRFVTQTAPEQEITGLVDKGLHNHNASHIGEKIYSQYAKLAVLAYDESDQIIGGIYGEVFWDWLHVDTLWVDENYRDRGIGARLLADIESEARSRGMIGAHLETTTFQARPFYEKQGYTVIGVLEDIPIGHQMFYLRKRWG